MQTNLQNKLFETYPNLFVQKDWSIQESCMAWGICIDDGWYDLLDNLCFLINQRLKNQEYRYQYLLKEYEKLPWWKKLLTKKPKYNHIDVQFAQIKEKFGILRIYLDGTDDFIDGLVSMAESASATICEVCGNKAQIISQEGWYRTRCSDHRNS